MKMKTRFIFLLMIACLKLHAQSNLYDSVTEARLIEAKKYLMGIGIHKDEPKAFGLYTQLAEAGNPKAMNILGGLYCKGIGTLANENAAINWFLKAARNGSIEGWYNIGLLYKDRPEAPDFENAYKYFDTAAKLGDAQSVYAMAYMHYKGLGCQQDYNKAAALFAKGANAGRSNSMYFYGLCLRNGYGVGLNKDSATYWLQKAAKKGYRMAINELASTTGENNNNAQATTLSTDLKTEFLSKSSALNQFQKIDGSTSAKVTTGEYDGYLVRYDWSGQYAISTSKLKLKLVNKEGKVTGQWIENDSIAIPLNADINSSSLVFSNMKYIRKDHYNPNKGASYMFKDANLQWSYNGDTMYLTGNIQMFSAKHNEPDKPIFVSVKRYAGKEFTGNNIQSLIPDQTSLLKDEVNAYPNPFVNTITVDFKLKQKSEVQIQLLTLDGKQVYEKKSGMLEAGSYTFLLHPKNLNAATYVLNVFYGKTSHTTKIVRL